jgi:hypothetical protein
MNSEDNGLELFDDKTVLNGKDEFNFFKIWPSEKYPGYFYMDRICLKDPPAYGETTRRPMTKEGIFLLLKYLEDEKEIITDQIEWQGEKWDGEEWNPLDCPLKNKNKENVYFIEAIGTGFVKIGRGSGICRVVELQNGCPFPLRLICEIQGKPGLEQKLHKKFKNSIFRGEWFYISQEIKSFIEKCKIIN